MSSVVLLDDSPLPAGFLLFAGKGEIEPATARTCTLMSPPFPVPSEAREAIAARKHIEFPVSITLTDSVFRIVGQVRSSEFLAVLLPASDTGSWSLSCAGGVIAAGWCERASRK